MTIYKFIITICNIVEYLNNWSCVFASDLNHILDILDRMFQFGDNYDSFKADYNDLYIIIYKLSQDMIQKHHLEKGFVYSPESSSHLELFEEVERCLHDKNIDIVAMESIISKMIINVYRTMKPCERKTMMFNILKNCHNLRHTEITAVEVRRHMNIISNIASSPRTPQA